MAAEGNEGHRMGSKGQQLLEGQRGPHAKRAGGPPTAAMAIKAPGVDAWGLGMGIGWDLSWNV